MSVVPFRPGEKAHILRERLCGIGSTVARGTVYVFKHFPYKNTGIFLHHSLNHVWKFLLICLILMGIVVYIVNSNVKEDCRHYAIMYGLASEEYRYGSESVKAARNNMVEACGYPAGE